MEKSILKFALLILLVFNISCDPGVEYKPENWRQEGNKFINKYENFDLEFSSIGGLIGEKSILPEGNIYNRGKSENKFKIEKAILKTNGKEYIAEQNFTYDTEIKIIKPDESQHFRLYFKLNNFLDKALKEPIEIDLIIKVGNQTTEVSIPMINSLEN